MRQRAHQSWRESHKAEAPPPAPKPARQFPPGAGICASGRTKGLSARPLETFGHRSWQETIKRKTPCKSSPRSVVFPGQISPMGERRLPLPLSIDLPLFGVPNVPDAESLSFSSFLSQPKEKEGPPPLGWIFPHPGTSFSKEIRA